MWKLLRLQEESFLLVTFFLIINHFFCSSYSYKRGMWCLAFKLAMNSGQRTWPSLWCKLCLISGANYLRTGVIMQTMYYKPVCSERRIRKTVILWRCDGTVELGTLVDHDNIFIVSYLTFMDTSLKAKYSRNRQPALRIVWRIKLAVPGFAIKCAFFLRVGA